MPPSAAETVLYESGASAYWMNARGSEWNDVASRSRSGWSCEFKGGCCSRKLEGGQCGSPTAVI